MARKQLDPAPRQYAATIRLNRRAANGPAVAGNSQSPESIEHWLLHDALTARDL